MSLDDVFTSAQTVVLRDGVCQNLSFQNIFGCNFCTENLVTVYIELSVYMLKYVSTGSLSPHDQFIYKIMSPRFPRTFSVKFDPITNILKLYNKSVGMNKSTKCKLTLF